MNTPALIINNLTVTYDNKPALWNISAQIPQEVLLAVIGPNGAGKTTLIKSILNLVEPIAGRITVLGKSYHHNRHKIAYVPQRSTVDWDFPATVFDIVLMGRYGSLGWFSRPSTHDIDATLYAIDQVGLTPYTHHPINQLSGGQQQRIFLARALVQNATLYLMDEPFAGVDTVTEKTTIELLKVMRDQGKTVIVVHHDLQTVRHYFDWLFLLNVKHIAHGHIEQVFTQEHINATYGAQSALIV